MPSRLVRGAIGMEGGYLHSIPRECHTHPLLFVDCRRERTMNRIGSLFQQALRGSGGLKLSSDALDVSALRETTPRLLERSIDDDSCPTLSARSSHHAISPASMSPGSYLDSVTSSPADPLPSQMSRNGVQEDCCTCGQTQQQLADSHDEYDNEPGPVSLDATCLIDLMQRYAECLPNFCACHFLTRICVYAQRDQAAS